MAAKRKVWTSGEIYIPKNLRGKIKIYVNKNGEVCIKQIKKK